MFKRVYIISIVLVLLSACGSEKNKYPIAEHSVDNVVIGEDNRNRAGSAVEGFLARVLYLAGGCTASLIGPDLALTAAHCLKKFIQENNGKHKFITHPYVYSKALQSTAKVIWAKWGSLNFKKHSYDDWAVLRIDKRMGDQLGYFGILGSLDSKSLYNFDLTLAGYSGDISGLSYHRGCDVTSYEPNNKLIHNCDLTKGASGGPLFKCAENGINNCLIVGIQSAHREKHLENIAISSARFYKSVMEAKEKSK